MRDPFVFDSRSEACKTPFGAVECGGAITFRVRPLRSEGFSRCILSLRREFSREEADYELSRDGEDGERVRFTVTVPAPDEPELLWYRFRFLREDGSARYYDRAGWNGGETETPYQITVYRKTHTPQWFGEGVTYQIFPDRFCRLAVPSAESRFGARVIHENWDDAPVWDASDGEAQTHDFFGGSLAGIASRLDALRDLGVTTLYLNPIFTSESNHRYNTADYREIDPMLGTEDDLRALCAEAKRRGMRVMLDGVFNHTGSQSRYFNACGDYDDLGAAQSPASPYYDWFTFTSYPDEYEAWWGIRSLPAVNETCPSYVDFIARGEDSVVRHYLRCGASAWRLDVADELPDVFIEQIRTAMEETDPDAFLLGEVWEDASNKIAYSLRRKYFLGRGLHGVMNYPLRQAILDYLLGGDADALREAAETLRENYPRDAFYSLMNFIGTHDTPRALTVLGADAAPENKADRAAYRLSPHERARGIARLKLAALFLFSFPGSPTVYYGDEVGVEGWEDPFCRAAYPWGREDTELRAYFARLGALRQSQDALRRGELVWRYTAGAILAFSRDLGNARLTAVLNASDAPQTLLLHCDRGGARVDLLTQRAFAPDGDTLTLRLAPYEGLLLDECFT